MSRIVKTWIVENTWKCTSCGHINRGRDMECRNCRSPREKREEDVVSSPDAPEVIDPKLLAQANAGVNWICSYCQAQERTLRDRCSNCGAERAQRQKGQESQQRLQRLADAADDGPHYVSAGGVPKAPKPAPRRGLAAKIAAALAASGAFVWFLVYLFAPHEAIATVSSMTWRHTSTLRQRVTLHGEGWGAPVGSFNEHCERRFKGNEDCHPHNCNPYQERYQCGSHDCNCHDSCKSLKNGYSSCSRECDSCSDYCTRTAYRTCYDQCPVYDDWCSYDYYEWPVVDEKTASGSGVNTTWPLLEVGPLQRLEKQAQYETVFSNGGKSWSTSPSTLDDYCRYGIGDRWKVKVNRAGQIWPLHREASK